MPLATRAIREANPYARPPHGPRGTVTVRRWRNPSEPVAPRGVNQAFRSTTPRDAGGTGRQTAQRVVGERARHKAPVRTEGGSARKGRSPRRHRRARPARVSRSERARHRDQGPEGARVRTLPRGARRIDARNVTRARASERGRDRCEEKALKGEA